jgi:chromosome segregation ATPase
MSTAQAKTNTPESLEAQLAQKRARLEELESQCDAADLEAEAATAAMIDGSADADRLSKSRAQRDALASAYKQLEAQIASLESSLEVAQAATGKAERAENLKLALTAYQEATIKTDQLLREFVAANAPALQELQNAAANVHRAEHAQFRENERTHWQSSALEHKQPCGDVRPILAHLNDYLAGKAYISLYAPAGKKVDYPDEHPVPFARLSKAGIS